MSARSEPDFRALFEAAPDRYLVLDRDLRIVAASDAYLAATMTQREDLVGRVIFDVFPADPADPAAIERERLIRSSLERVRDKRMPDAVAVQKHDIPRPIDQGGEIEVRYWSPLHSPVVDERNQVSYIIHRVEDVTEYVQLQELGDRQQAITDELLDRSARMEAEILRRSQELQAANNALHRANEAKGEFLSLVSHELRTPLTAILGFSELLATRSDLGEKESEWVKLTHVAGRHLLTLIDEVMDLSRIESGQVSVSPETVPLPPLLIQAFELMQPVAESHHVTIHRPRWHEGCGYVVADPQRLKQVVINLLSNAIKYNRAGGIVEVEAHSVAGDRVRLTVTDSGEGMDDESLAKLFTPFERLGAGSTGIQGTGLGLALSRRLVEAMGGTIGVTSVPGSGSTFWVELAHGEPVAVEERDAVSDSDGDVTAIRVYPALRHLLYVEDVVANLQLVEDILDRRPSVRVIPAMLGRLGIDLAEQHQPDLILLDLHLPDLNGDEVLAALQANPETRGIPVVMLSADATKRELKRLLSLGARAYLTKPIGVRAFLEVVDEYLSAAPEGVAEPWS